MPIILRNTPVNRTVHHLLMLDASGSMKRLKLQALDAANEMIQTSRNTAHEYADEREHKFSLVMFNTSGVRYIYKDADASTIEDLAPSQYSPDGGTPLYDTIGQVLTHVEMNVAVGDKVIVNLITEGLDTASQEYSSCEVTQLLARLRMKGWTIKVLKFCADAANICCNRTLCRFDSAQGCCCSMKHDCRCAAQSLRFT